MGIWEVNKQMQDVFLFQIKKQNVIEGITSQKIETSSPNISSSRDSSHLVHPENGESWDTVLH